MSLPNFLVIGAMKAGTTSLYHYLKVHPQVFMPPTKELDFFVEELNWGRGLDWYEQQFERAPHDKVALGEASTSYTMHPHYRGVPERISENLPEARLIYVVRSPIERIRSHYQHDVITGDEGKPIDEAVLENPAYIDCSRYAYQIEQYGEYFSSDQLLIITSEMLDRARPEAMCRVFEFLGVDPEFIPPNLGRDFYRSDDRISYPPVVAFLRRTLKKRSPQIRLSALGSVGHHLRSLLRQGDDKSPRVPFELSRETKQKLQELLANDQNRLKSYLEDGETRDARSHQEVHLEPRLSKGDQRRTNGG
jgi:Sulfotransferase domain